MITKFYSNTRLKLFAFCALSAIVIFIYASYTDYYITQFNNFYEYENETLKYILQWTSPKTMPFVYMDVGRAGFKSRNCTYTNCVVTPNRSLLGDLRKFDVIMFHGPELHRAPRSKDWPKNRAPHQKYVFASVESSHYYPVCSPNLDNFFNWTWTFRLDSDARWGYMLIKDSKNTVIGPNKIMHWMKLEDMDPVSEEFKVQLRSKFKAAVWFVSNCNDKSGRKAYADKLQIQLQAKYNLTLDVFGKCGTMKCGGWNSQESCDKLIKENYYFYLAFENSLSEDYVTEKLLRALKFDSVPIVLGFANYTRYVKSNQHSFVFVKFKRLHEQSTQFL